MEKMTIELTTHNGDLIGVTKNIEIKKSETELYIKTSGNVTLSCQNPSSTIKIDKI